MARLGLLIDYEFCSGCHTCEMACQMEHQFPVGQFGIRVAEIGPWQIEGDTWQYSYVPVPTDQCDLCIARTDEGKLPTCVQHCQASVMEYGPVDELAEKLATKRKMVLFTPV